MVLRLGAAKESVAIREQVRQRGSACACSAARSCCFLCVHSPFSLFSLLSFSASSFSETYVGSFTCGSPANPATCGPLSMMCQGFLPGTAPAVCNANTCEAGVQRDACGVCGGSVTDGAECEKKSSFPVGAVIGVIIVCCVLIGGGVYCQSHANTFSARACHVVLCTHLCSLLSPSSFFSLQGTCVVRIRRCATTSIRC